jgi:hypothetical protein
MSWTTGTQTEALSVNPAVGSAYSTSTTSTVISTAASAGFLPANFFLPSFGVAKGLLVKAFGVLSTTATPNLTLAVVANGTQNAAPATLSAGTAGVLATSGTLAQGSGVTNVPWDLEVLFSCSTVGGSGTILGDGMWRIYNTATTINVARVSSSTANPNTPATLSTQLAYYVELAALWGTNSASNTITLYGYTVLGLN